MISEYVQKLYIGFRGVAFRKLPKGFIDISSSNPIIHEYDILFEENFGTYCFACLSIKRRFSHTGYSKIFRYDLKSFIKELNKE